jgi:hypothetical protein
MAGAEVRYGMIKRWKYSTLLHNSITVNPIIFSLIHLTLTFLSYNTKNIFF